MTETECAELIRMNFVLYKLGAKPLTDEELRITAAVWFYHFRQYPYAAVKRAFLEANKVCVFPIQPADIFAQLQKSGPGAEGVWQQIAAAAVKARQYIGWRACPMVVGVDERGKPVKSTGEAEIESLYAELPESARLWLGGPSGLVDLARTGDAELDSYRRGEFLRYAREAPVDRAADAARNLLPDKGAPVSGMFAAGTDVPRRLKRKE